MKGNSGNIKQYNTEDIQRYVRGEMTDQEMHAIEKAALEDEFLSDAIEGYADAISNSGEEEIEASSKDLHQRLSERINPEKRKNIVPVFRMKWWQGAVAAAIIVTAGVLGYRSYNDRAASVILTSTKQPGKNLSTGPVSESGPAPASTTLNADTGLSTGALTKSTTGDTPSGNKTSANSAQPAQADASLKDNGKTLEPTRKQEDQLAFAREEKDLASARAPEPSALYSRKENEAAINNDSPGSRNLQPLNQVLQGRAAGVSVEKQRGIAKKKTRPGADASVADSESKSEKYSNAEALKADPAKAQIAKGEKINSSQLPLGYYKGQIVTPDNKPLSNAVLTVTSTNASYTTDNNGKFVIPSSDSVIDVNVTLVGSQSTSFRLQNNTLSNQLVMPPAIAEMSEVVVIGYGTARKKDITGSVTVIGSVTLGKHRAEPEGGWIAFEDYLEKNKDTTLNGSGETQVSFEVSSRNRLSDFKITKSISPEHDKEIIRLIQSGPKWKIFKGRKANVTVTARF